MRTTFAVAAIGTVAVLVFALLPVISGVLVEKFVFDDVQTGFAVTAYFAVFAVITSTSGLWIRRFSWSKLLIIGFMAMIIGIGPCVFAETFSVAQVSFALVGAGAGLLFPISFTIASEMRNTDRVFADKSGRRCRELSVKRTGQQREIGCREKHDQAENHYQRVERKI